MEKRNKEIKRLRKKGWKYLKIANKYSISTERVRQIVNSGDKTQLSEERDVLLTNLKKEYRKKFHDKMSQKHLLEDIESLSKPSRKQEDVIKRDALIRYLYEELEIPFYRIGVLLHRNHTSIIHSYKKSCGENNQRGKGRKSV